MNTTLKAKLERIKNRATLYEVVARHPDGRRVLLGYTNGRGRRGLCDLITGRRERAEAIGRLCGAETFHTAKRAKDGATCGDWHLNFTGRTRRDAYLEGELPYVEEVA